MKNISYIIIFSLLQFTTLAQTLMDRKFDDTNIQHVVISNLSGSVTVTGTNAKEIHIVARLKDGKMNKEMKLSFKKEKNYLIAHVETPCTSFNQDSEFDPSALKNIVKWKNNCNWKNDQDDLPIVDFEVQVPQSMNVYASSILNGDIEVKQVSGNVWANHIDGDITLANVSKVTQAKTISGEIEIDYTNAPTVDSDFSTISGDIKVKIKGTINVLTSFKSFTGSFYTDADDIKKMPGSLIKKETKKGLNFSFSDSKSIKIGNGGVHLNFETLSGSAYLTSN